MCGIVGTIDTSHAPLRLTDEAAERALNSIAHRGPDDSGMWWNSSRSVFLGHRRLSIIDLSEAGHQPMTNETGTLHCVYNGEVYNFEELRRELQGYGHTFRSGTDTEVIIHGYEEFGPGIVDRLRGMFAFAIYDETRRGLFIARDRLGIKPLYYHVQGNVVSFASEIRALLELPEVARELNEEALHEYLAFGKVYAPKTMFRGIYKFPAGHYQVIFGSPVIEPRRYWTPYENRHTFSPNESETAVGSRLLGLLEESVRLRMISDVPVGVFLSGGVDSTANVALMSRLSSTPVHTFTAGFQGQSSFDEREIARAASRYYGTEHQEIEITERDLLEHLPTISAFLDEPVADATVIPIYYLSKLARSAGVPVILNGDGGDELFCGYRKYMQFLRLAPYWRRLQSLPGWSRSLIARTGNRIGVSDTVSDLLQRAASDVEMYVGSTGPLKGTSEFRQIIDPAAGGNLYAAVQRGRSEFNAERRTNDYAEWLSWWGVRSEVEHIFLYRADRMGMANSVEIRVPFLDHRLVEFAQQMPQRMKYREGEAKHILKKSLEGLVPREFLYRKKQGFCVPLREWGGELMEAKAREVLPRIHREWGVLTPDFFDAILERSGSSANTDRGGALTWMLFNLAVWYESWF